MMGGEEIPDYLGEPAAKIDGGIWVLTVSARCKCGYSDYGVAPSWKVPAEDGGGYLTSQCPGCLGTLEFEEKWERLDRLVTNYSDLKPGSGSGRDE